MPNIRTLRTVREQRGFDISEVASSASIAVDRLIQIESGNREPSRKQMERLAETYGVPLYSLFNDGIPNLPPLPTDFRTSNLGPASLSPKGVRTYLSSERVSTFSQQLAVELGFEPASLSEAVKEAKSTKRRAIELRRAFENWFQPRQEALGFTGRAEQKFMAALRLFFEVQGGIVNVNDAPADDFQGFFIKPDSGLPTIFINRSISSRKAQLFTLVHEYSHALLGQEGISDPFTTRNSIERACNVFAAEFLAPMADFAALIEGLPRHVRSDSIELINTASAATLLSKHAAAIRLVEADYISKTDFRSWRRLFRGNRRQEKDEERESEVSSGGVPHAKRLTELGHLPVVLAKRAVDEKIVDAFDVADGLGLSRTLQERAFALAVRRFEVAVR